MRVAGTFNGTGADIYLCIGFVPDWVHLFNYETANNYELIWNREMMRSAEFVEGMQVHTGTTYRQITALTIDAGIQPYYGGVVLNSTTAGVVTYGEGIFLKPDNRNYRFTNADSPFGIGDASESSIDTWTLNTAANHTGNFGATGAVTGTYIGEGSMIQIDGRMYSILALTADGGDTDDVTLSAYAASGTIESIGGMYSTRPMISGEVTKDGFLCGNDIVNTNNALIGFQAGKYDW